MSMSRDWATASPGANAVPRLREEVGDFRRDALRLAVSLAGRPRDPGECDVGAGKRNPVGDVGGPARLPCDLCVLGHASDGD
eukprot:1353555-Pyramimonas_sp.AAC.1